MKTKNLLSLVKLAETKTTNPFKLIGIEAWILKVMTYKELKEFISDFKKVLAKYFHPDKHLGNKKEYNIYFKTVSSEIDRLLKDEFYFKKSLDEFKDDSILHLQEIKIDSYYTKIKDMEKEIRNLSKKVGKKNKDLVETANLFLKLKKFEKKLMTKSESYSIDNLKVNIEYVLFNDYEKEFTTKFVPLIKSCKNHLSLEVKCKKLMSEYIQNYIQSTKTSIWVAKVNEGIYKKIGRKNKKSQFSEKHQIIGSIPYYFIKKFLEYYDIKIEKEMENLFNGINIGTLLLPLIDRKFRKNEINPNIHLKKLIPFLSSFVFPLTITLVKVREKRKEGYAFIVPLSFYK